MAKGHRGQSAVRRQDLRALDNLCLSSDYLEGPRSFEHQVGRLSETLDDVMTRYLVKFILSLGQNGERPLLGFCPALQTKFSPASDHGWRTLRGRVASGARLPWIIGYPNDEATFCRVFQMAWNSANNEPVVVVFAPEPDMGDVLARVEETTGLYPGSEEQLIDAYPTVVSRYYDGLWLRVLSRRLTPEDAAGCFAEAMSGSGA